MEYLIVDANKEGKVPPQKIQIITTNSDKRTLPTRRIVLAEGSISKFKLTADGYQYIDSDDLVIVHLNLRYQSASALGGGPAKPFTLDILVNEGPVVVRTYGSTGEETIKDDILIHLKTYDTLAFKTSSQQQGGANPFFMILKGSYITFTHTKSIRPGDDSASTIPQEEPTVRST